MSEQQGEVFYHNRDADWLLTSEGKPRGYIQPEILRELWFHTGTVCNLHCPFCLEGSSPNNDRLQPLTFEDTKPFIDEAVIMGVCQFSFTGGEPFMNPEFLDIIDYALNYRPCLVLTNATHPLLNLFEKLALCAEKAHPLMFRVSLDYPEQSKHDVNRGEGNFALSLDVMKQLHQLGFKVSIARQASPVEDCEEVDRAYRSVIKQTGLPEGTNIVSFPDLLPPNSHPENVPEIMESCMTTYKTAYERKQFMCNYSKMVIKKNDHVAVYACTLVDDDDGYDLGRTLNTAMLARVMLRHHRCYACFASGASCSEG